MLPKLWDAHFQAERFCPYVGCRKAHHNKHHHAAGYRRVWVGFRAMVYFQLLKIVGEIQITNCGIRNPLCGSFCRRTVGLCLKS